MSQSSKSTEKTNNIANAILPSAEQMAETSKEGKRCVSEESVYVEKEMMVNVPSTNKTATASDEAMSAKMGFIKATEVINSTSTKVEIVDEITDEELLEVALMLESEMQKQI